MRIVCIGGGPAGLYFALLMKKLHPAHASRWSSATGPTTRSAGAWCSPTPPWTTCGRGTRRPPTRSRTPSTTGTTSRCCSRAASMRTTGHGFVGIGRKKLLNILQARCEELGVELVVRARGRVRPRIPRRRPDHRRPTASTRRSATDTRTCSSPTWSMRPNRYIWLGTNKLYDAFTFDFRKTEHGWFQAHIYKFDDEHLDLHRRDHGGRVRGARPRPAGPGRVDRLLRGPVRRGAGRRTG